MTPHPDIEQHPLQPFLPEGARILKLGSFPPKRERWSMEFFYPNWINDMWRIMGHIFFDNKHHFEIEGQKRFDKEAITEFCIARGIALYDAAQSIRRLKDNASDKFLEVVSSTDIDSLLNKIPSCQAIITTGEKATEIVAQTFGCNPPKVGTSVEITTPTLKLRFWRMPSSSRAYPLSLEKKAEAYRTILHGMGMI